MFLNSIGRECTAKEGVCQFHLKQYANVQGWPHGGRGREGVDPLLVNLGGGRRNITLACLGEGMQRTLSNLS